jgi:hypothetical protein
MWLIEEAEDDMNVNIGLCPAVITTVIDTLLHSPEDRRQLIEPILIHLPQISQIFNTSHPIIAVFQNYDNCNCRNFHNIPQPPGLTPVIFNAMQQSYWFGGQVLFNSTASIVIGPFIQELIDFMDQKVSLPLHSILWK